MTTSKPIPTDDELRRKLTPAQYAVVREQATEPAFTGVYLDNKADGTYHCLVCGQSLFSSADKYDSGSGWPSFWQAVDKDTVELRSDSSHGMQRTEVVCGNCGAHLGHVFEDGPQPSGQRFCINSAALAFDPTKPAGDKDNKKAEH